MKNYFTCLIALFLSLSLFAQDKNYTITVSARKYSAPYKAYLQYRGLNGEVKDSVNVIDGSFTFSGTVDEPRPASIVLMQPGKRIAPQDIIKFYIEPGNLTATARSLISNAEFTGSPATKDNVDFNKILASANLEGPQRITTVTQVVSVPAGQAPPSMVTGPGQPMPRSGPGVTKTVTTDMSQLPYEVRSAIAAMREEAKYKVLDFIKSRPASFVSMYTLHSLLQTQKITYDEYLPLFTMLDRKLLESNGGKLMFPR
jgi:hypothetical protein